MLKPDILPCNFYNTKFYEHYVNLQKPLLLQGCIDVCARKDWDFAGDIIPSETGRKWTFADSKTGRFTGRHFISKISMSNRSCNSFTKA